MRTFAFITDLHLDEQMPADHGVDTKKNLGVVLNDIASRDIADIVIGGDIGEPSVLGYFFSLLKPFSFNLILGNHDRFSEVSKFFNPQRHDSELFYSVDHNDTRFIFLDSSSERISAGQLEWLETKVNMEKTLVVCVHHPVLQIDASMDKIYPLRNRDDVRGVLEKNARPVLVLSGHYHMNDDQTVGNIRQLVTHGVSFQVDKFDPGIKILNSSFGYRIINIEDEGISSEVVTFSSIT